MRRSILIVALALCLPAAIYAADWPQFRGPWATGNSPEKGISKSWRQQSPRQLWRVSLSDNGYAGPSVAGGKLFIIDHKGNSDIVRAINIANGRDVWRFTYPDTNKQNYGFARATPTVAGGKVYTLSRLGVLHCLNAGTGKKIWAVDVVKQFGGKRGGWDLGGSPLVDGNKVIVNPGGARATVVALDARSGKALWGCAANDLAGYSTPVVANLAGRRQYLVFGGTKLLGVDAASGKLLWSIPWKTEYDVNAASPIVMGNSVFITSGYGVGCALVDVTTGGARIPWRSRDIQSQFNTPVAVGGALFSTSDPGYLVCLDPKSGKTRWKQRGFEKGGLCGVDGTLIVVDGARGDVALVAANPAGYQELGRFRPLGGQSWTAPIVADGKLFVRNQKGLGCYALR